MASMTPAMMSAACSARGLGKCGEDHQAALFAALLRPLLIKALDRVTQGGLVRPAGAHRCNDGAPVAKQVRCARARAAGSRSPPGPAIPRLPRPPSSRTSTCPSKSPTLVINSPHWVASRLTTLTPSAGSFQQRGQRGQEMHVRVRRHPAVLPPVESLFERDVNHLGVRADDDHLSNRLDFKALAHFHVKISQGQLR